MDSAHQVIVAARATNQTSDKQQAAAMMEETIDNVGAVPREVSDCSKIARRQRAREKGRRLRADPEFRERTNARERERWATDQPHRERKKESNKNWISKRYHEEPAYKQYRKERVKKSMADHPRYQQNKEANHKEKLRSDPEYRETQRDYQMVHKFRLARGEYAQMELEQGGRCAICHQANPHGYRLAVDHHHSTGQIRGLLCHNCNVGIGHFFEDTQRMMGTIVYLQELWYTPQEIPRIPDERMFDRFKIPYWELQSRDKNFRQRSNTKLGLRYGIDLDQYEWLLEQRNGVCWICLQAETRKSRSKTIPVSSLSVDHDDESGAVRGLLWRSWPERARSTAPRTAPSSPIPIGNRRASTPTWNGSKASYTSPCTSWTTGAASGRT